MQAGRTPRILCLLFMTMSMLCASSEQLAEQALREFEAGHYELAVEKSLQSLKKDSGNRQAQDLLTRSAQQIFDDRYAFLQSIEQSRIGLAADGVLKLEKLFQDIEPYEIILQIPDDYTDVSSRVLDGAAEYYFARALGDMEADEYRKAYLNFDRAAHYRMDYPGLQERKRQAHDLAVQSIALFALQNQTGIPGLSKLLSDRLFLDVRSALNPKTFPFTRLIDLDSVYNVLPVGQVDNVTGQDALQMGRQLYADRVLIGRMYNIRVLEPSHIFHEMVYQKVYQHDQTGKVAGYRIDTLPLDVYMSAKQVQFQYEIQILAVSDGRILQQFQKEIEAKDYAIWTDMIVSGDPEHDYYLTAPDETGRAKKSERIARLRWREKYGRIELKDILMGARAEQDFSDALISPWSYYDYRAAKEVFPTGALCLRALRPAWEGVYDALKALENQ